jgi:hypothetical protein
VAHKIFLRGSQNLASGAESCMSGAFPFRGVRERLRGRRENSQKTLDKARSMFYAFIYINHIWRRKNEHNEKVLTGADITAGISILERLEIKGLLKSNPNFEE